MSRIRATRPGRDGMRVLVASWLGSTNLGDELVFRGLRNKLWARGVSVAGISVDPAATRRVHGVGSVPHDAPADVLAAVASADRVVFGGGGIIQDETSHFNLPYHLARLGAARLLRRPAAVVGVGAGPVTTPAGRALTRLALAGDLPVSVRDAASAAVLADLGVEDPVVAGDLALSLPVPDVAVGDHLVAALRPWSGGGSAPVGAYWQEGLEHPWLVEATAAGLDAAARATGLQVRLVALQRGRDDRLHERVADRMRTPVTTVTPDIDGVLAELGAGRVVVATRYHGGIGALLGGRPMVLVRYSPKVAALARDVGRGAVVLPWEEDAIRGLARAVQQVAGRGADVAVARERLRTRERRNDTVLEELLAAGPRPGDRG